MVPAVPAAPALAESVLRDCLDAFAHVRFAVRGDCMEPALPAGATVLVASTSRRQPRFGDVVLVRQNEGLRLHRLVWGPPLPGLFWRTKGDRALHCDRRFGREAALGTVLGVETPNGTRPVASVTLALRSLFVALRQRLGRPGSR
jgi:hypothetical protein